MMGEALPKPWAIQCAGWASMKCGVGLRLRGEAEGGGGRAKQRFMNGNDRRNPACPAVRRRHRAAAIRLRIDLADAGDGGSSGWAALRTASRWRAGAVKHSS
jgi:hypothetical protein